jgi:hypothetical protein
VVRHHGVLELFCVIPVEVIGNSVKKIILATITASLAVTGTAYAGTPGSSNGVTTRLTGNTSADYADAVFGNTSCNETQHPKFDTVSCTLGTPNLSQAGTSATVGWLSDFNGTYGTFSYTFSADGSTYYGKATY